MTNITSITTTTTPSPTAFDWQGTPLRTFRDAKGLVWFVAQDVCQALGLTNTARAIARLDADTKGVTTVNTLGGTQAVTTINEPGLYALNLIQHPSEGDVVHKRQTLSGTARLEAQVHRWIAAKVWRKVFGDRRPKVSTAIRLDVIAVLVFSCTWGRQAEFPLIEQLEQLPEVFLKGTVRVCVRTGLPK